MRKLQESRLRREDLYKNTRSTKVAKQLEMRVNKLINIIYCCFGDDTRLVRVVTNIIGLKEDKLAKFRF